MHLPEEENIEEEHGGQGALNSVSERDSNALVFLQKHDFPNPRAQGFLYNSSYKSIRLF